MAGRIAPPTGSGADGGGTLATVSVAAILAESAARHPTDVAVIVGEDRTTYAELWTSTLAYAGALRALGVQDGDRVAILIPNVADFPRVYYAVLALGAVVVPVHTLLKRHEIEYVLRDSGAALLVCAVPLLDEGAAGAELAGVQVVTVLGAAEGFERLEAVGDRSEPLSALRPRHPSETATVLYTSGSTGRPKGAEGSHFALLEQVNTNLLTTLDMRRGDVLLGALPLFHTFGQTCMMNTGFRAGATIVLLPRFDGDTALALMAEHDTDIFMGVPTMYTALLDAAGRTDARPRLRYAISGGAALPLTVLERFEQVYGAPIHEGYGLTETSPAVTFNHVGVPPRAGTVGTPVWGVDVEIVDPDAVGSVRHLPPGAVGEVVVRGHNLMNGYWNRPEDTAAVMTEGWFRTGDLGMKDRDGYLTLIGRSKDVIIRNGYNVYPREVEEALEAHPDVVMASVFGVPHDEHGEEVAAAVQVRGTAGVTAEDLIGFVAGAIAAYKYPRTVHILDQLPTGSTGKVLKNELIARFGGGTRT